MQETAFYASILPMDADWAIAFMFNDRFWEVYKRSCFHINFDAMNHDWWAPRQLQSIVTTAASPFQLAVNHSAVTVCTACAKWECMSPEGSGTRT